MYALLFTRFGIEEAKVNRRTFFSIVALTTAAASKLYIHIDIVTVGVYEILPKTTEKKCMRKLMHTGRWERQKNPSSCASVWNFCCQCFLSMCATASSSQESALDDSWRASVYLWASNVRKIPSFIDIKAERQWGDSKYIKSAQPHRQFFLRLHVFYLNFPLFGAFNYFPFYFLVAFVILPSSPHLFLTLGEEFHAFSNQWWSSWQWLLFVCQ